jgi:hypothetical protein
MAAAEVSDLPAAAKEVLQSFLVIVRSRLLMMA